jgi:hypothetical protein
MRDTVLEHGKGTVKEGFGAIHNLLKLTNRVLDEGHMVADVGDDKLANWREVSKIRNKITYAQAMSELQAEAKELGVEI